VKLVVDSDGVDEVESIEPEEETGDPAGQLQQLEGGGGVVGIFQVELGPRVVEDGKEGEVASVAPVKGR